MSARVALLGALLLLLQVPCIAQQLCGRWRTSSTSHGHSLSLASHLLASSRHTLVTVKPLALPGRSCASGALSLLPSSFVAVGGGR